MDLGVLVVVPLIIMDGLRGYRVWTHASISILVTVDCAPCMIDYHQISSTGINQQYVDILIPINSC